MLLLPLAVLAAALDVGDERVERDGVMMRMVEGRSECEVGPELQAAVPVVRGLLWGLGDEQQH